MASDTDHRDVDTGDEPDRPLYLEEMVEAVRSRPPLRPLDPAERPLELDFLVAGDGEPRVEVEAERIARAGGHEPGDGRAEAYRIKLRIANAILGSVVEPPDVKIVQFVDEHDSREAQGLRPESDAMVPDHLALRALPRRSIAREAALRRALRDRPAQASEDELYRATTIFGADDRYTFRDTAYPWSTAGRVTSPLGAASGVMVGPRHLLTCSHIVQWLPGNSAGWIRFAPAYYDGGEPFGAAWGTRIYWQGRKVFGPTISRDEAQHDYVCVVLDRTIGNLTGWMGSRSWSDSWDGGTYWSHIGYPGDLGGQRPSYQSSIALDGSFWDREVHTRIFHHADVWPGQSGGPFFGWWAGEGFPRVVADQSAHNSDENIASGGAHMIGCIIRARNDHP